MEEKNTQNSNNNDSYQKNSNGNKKSGFNLWWIYALIFIPLITIYIFNDSSSMKEIGWTEFQQMMREDVFDEIVVLNKKNILEATVKKDKYREVFKQDAAKAAEQNVKVAVKIPSADKFSDFYDKEVSENNISTRVAYKEGDDLLWNILVSIGPFVIIILIWILIMRRMSGGVSGDRQVLFIDAKQ